MVLIVWKVLSRLLTFLCARRVPPGGKSSSPDKAEGPMAREEKGTGALGQDPTKLVYYRVARASHFWKLPRGRDESWALQSLNLS